MTALIGFKIGPYSIVKRLGEGTAAESYLAKDDKGKLAVAKCLSPELVNQPAVVERFLAACQTSSKIRIPRHIAKTLSQKKSPEGIFLLREFVEGKPLTEFLTNSPTMAIDAKRAALDICDALRALAKPGVVHGGLHPNNLIVQEDGRIKVTDYGTSLIALTNTLQKPYSMGALRYVSPEQVAGQDASPRSDIYSAGLLIWAIDKRRDGIEATDHDGIVRQIRTGVSPSCEVLLAAVHKDPKRRYSSIDDLRKRIADRPHPPTAPDVKSPPPAPAKTKQTPPSPPPPPGPPAKTGKLTGVYDVLGKAQLIGSGPPKPLHVTAAGQAQRPLQLTNGGNAPLELSIQCFGQGVQANPEKLNVPAGKMASAIVTMDATAKFAKIQLSWQEKVTKSVVVQIVRSA